MIKRMNMTNNRQASQGFTLIELMISITVSSLLALAIASSYASQASTYMTQAYRTQATEDGRDAFTILNHLLHQAEAASIAITTVADTSTIIDFTVPAGYQIWPNTTPPYTNNAVRVSWTNTGSTAYQILIGTADSTVNLATAPMTALVGSNSGNNSRITNLSLVNGASSYALSVTSTAGITGLVGKAQAANGATGGVTFDGIIVPRN